MITGHCAECGKKGDFTRVCGQCYLSRKSILESFKDIEIRSCPFCAKQQEGNSWAARGSIEEAVQRAVKRAARIASGIMDPQITVTTQIPEHTVNEGNQIELEAEVSVTAVPEDVGQAVEDHYTIPASLRYLRCTGCSKLGTQYFEGVLQLRNPHDEARRFIVQRVSREDGVSINDEKDVKNGLDFYVTNGHFLRKLAQLVHERFGGELKLSPRLYSKDRQTGKQIYRVMALCRLPDFKAGDIIEIVEHEESSILPTIILITSITGSKLAGNNLATGKRVHFDFLGKEIEILKRVKAQVSRIHPHVEVLDPETFQSVPVSNHHPPDVEEGAQVEAIKCKGYLFVIPAS